MLPFTVIVAAVDLGVVVLLWLLFLGELVLGFSACASR
jgi:hypothetical protein